MGRSGSIITFLEKLSEGDPIAIGMAVAFGIGLAFVGVIATLELMDKYKEKQKKTRTSSRKSSKK